MLFLIPYRNKNCIVSSDFLQWICFIFIIFNFLQMKSNFSFASRLRAAQDTLTVLKSKEDYVPLRQEESKEGFESLIDTVIAANTAIINLYKEKKLMVKERHDLFYTGTDSVMNIISTLKNNVKFQFGKNSGEFELLKEISSRMKYVRSQIPVTTDSEPASETVQILKTRTVKSGERTFASLTKIFNDFVTTIDSFGGFSPSNELFKKDKLHSISESLTKLNDDLESKLLEIRTEIQNRLQLYVELSDRVSRIKLSVKAQYGANSSVYKQIRTKNV